MYSLDLSKIEELEKYINEAQRKSDEIFMKGSERTKEEEVELNELQSLVSRMAPFFDVRVK